MLTISNLNFKRQAQQQEILSEFSICIPPSSITCIIGDNGSGKTTLLKIIAHLIKDYSGEILFHGFNLKKEPRIIQDEICLITTASEVFPEMNVKYHLNLWAALYKNESLIAATAKYFGLEEILHKKVSHISSGMKQRLKLSRLMLSNRKIWLLDEPFTYLDKDATETLLTFMKIRADQGGIVILTSHVHHHHFDNFDIVDLGDWNIAK